MEADSYSIFMDSSFSQHGEVLTVSLSTTLGRYLPLKVRTILWFHSHHLIYQNKIFNIILFYLLWGFAFFSRPGYCPSIYVFIRGLVIRFCFLSVILSALFMDLRLEECFCWDFIHKHFTLRRGKGSLLPMSWFWTPVKELPIISTVTTFWWQSKILNLNSHKVSYRVAYFYYFWWRSFQTDFNFYLSVAEMIRIQSWLLCMQWFSRSTWPLH